MQSFLKSLSILSLTASTSRRQRVEKNDSDDSDSCFDFREETTGGMNSSEESELDRLLANESKISR